MQYTIASDEERILKSIRLGGSPGAQSSSSGLHGLNKTGNNIEFREYQTYTSGEDCRHVDWKVYARTGRRFIKRFNEERNACGILSVDVSPSMRKIFPGTHTGSKAELAARFAFYCAHLYYLNKEKTGLFFFDTHIRKMLPPGAGAAAYNTLYQALGESLSDETDTPHHTVNAWRSCFNHIRIHTAQRSSLFILSDFYAEIDDIISACVPLVKSKIIVHLIHICDSNELNADFLRNKNYLFIDCEDSRKRIAIEGFTAEGYTNLLVRHANELKKACHAANMSYTQAITGKTVFSQFLHFVRTSLTSKSM